MQATNQHPPTRWYFVHQQQQHSCGLHLWLHPPPDLFLYYCTELCCDLLLHRLLLLAWIPCKLNTHCDALARHARTEGFSLHLPMTYTTCYRNAHNTSPAYPNCSRGWEAPDSPWGSESRRVTMMFMGNCPYHCDVVVCLCLTWFSWALTESSLTDLEVTPLKQALVERKKERKKSTNQQIPQSNRICLDLPAALLALEWATPTAWYKDEHGT